MNSPNKKKLLFTLRHAPYGSSLAKEALDAILATSVYEQDLSVLFMDDGVFQLIESQQADVIGEKNMIKILSAFALYDIDALFACEASLNQRGLTKSHIPDQITIIDDESVKSLLRQQDHLLSF